MKLEDILAGIGEITHIRREGDHYYLLFPFFHRYADESLSLCFYMEGEDLCVSDCGATDMYLDIRYMNREDYRDEIERIKRRFCFTETPEHAFVMRFPSDQLPSIVRFLGFFLQGLTLIANMDLRDA